MITLEIKQGYISICMSGTIYSLLYARVKYIKGQDIVRYMSKVNFRMAINSATEIETDDLTKVERQDAIRKVNALYKNL